MKLGKQIVITAPLTEAIDHAGYFIQMALASIPVWMERFIDRKYPVRSGAVRSRSSCEAVDAT